MLRDFWAAPRLEVRREDRKRERAAFSVYRSYADPLAAATTSVFWRLHEAFYDPGRAAYLKFADPVTEFQRYKKESTVYRLAALFGWIQAFRRDLSFFTLDDKTRVHAVEEAVGALEHALAEGKLVEARRAKELAELWGVALPEDPDLISEAAVEMEEAVKTRHHVDELWQVARMADGEKLRVCATAASALARSAGAKKVPRETLEAELTDAVRILAVREAWIFRDQQGAIGDVMLEEILPGGSAGRRFDVKGYAAFHKMLYEDIEPAKNVWQGLRVRAYRDTKADSGRALRHVDQNWFGPIEKMLDGVDLREENGTDARVVQLRKILVATARILVSIVSVDERPGSVSEITVRTAKEVLCDKEQEGKRSTGDDASS